MVWIPKKLMNIFIVGIKLLFILVIIPTVNLIKNLKVDPRNGGNPLAKIEILGSPKPIIVEV
jgi:hypothetical protein